MGYFNFTSKTQQGYSRIDSLWPLALVIALTAIMALFTGSQMVLADGSGNADTEFNGCMQDVYDAFGQGGGLNCTAKDVSLATATNITIHDADGGCAFPGDTVTFTADFQVEVTAGSRHDIGIYFALDGDPNSDGALTGDCTISTPAYAPVPDWLDLDGTGDNTTASNDFGYCSTDGGTTIASPTTPCDGGSPAAGDAQCVAALGSGATCEEFGDGITTPIQDTCGDISKPDFSPLFPTLTLTVTCVDDDGDGQLDLPYCTSWRQSGANELCLTPLAAYPGSPSKCNCDPGFGIDIVVPGQIIVDKVSDPANDPTSFDFTLSGPDADLPINFSLTDQAAPFESPGLDAGTYSVTETANSSYSTIATCDDGSDPSAIDLQPGEIVTCTFTNELLEGPPVITVEKTADPTSVFEPGGDVTFTVSVTNDSDPTDPVTIDTLTDTIYGSLNGVGTCSVPQTIQPGDTYICDFTANVSGNAGEIHLNTATASGTDDEGTPVSDSDDATVTIDDVFPGNFPPTVIKTADPISVPEPGALVTFSVTVINNSPEQVTLTALVDDIHGDLNGQGDCAVPQTLAPAGEVGDSYTCSFQANVSGNAGDTETDTVTGTVVDDEGNQAQAADDATVTVTDVPSSIELLKTANPTSVDEPGGDVTYTFMVYNTSAVDEVTIDSLTDSIYGDLSGQGDCSVPQTIPAGGSYNCSITEAVNGNFGDTITNVATASGVDDDGNPLSDDDDAVVTITDSFTNIQVTKTANPTSVSEPGGSVTFSVTINNPSAIDSVTINSLTDTIYGDLNGQGGCAVPQTIAAGGSYSCSFSADVNGNTGYSETDVVTASGVDEDGVPVSDSDDAIVTVFDALPNIAVEKSADPTSVDEPGGDVTFTIVVNNTSATSDPVTINSLTDSIHGDLNGQGDCSVPQTIPAGNSYSCSFTAFVDGNAGDSETDVATASGTDDEGNPVSDNDDATVTINDVPSEIEIIKTADPISVDEPGGDVTYTFTVNNLSVADEVTIESLTDSIYGDLNGQGDCSVPQTIAVGGSYSCSIIETVSGNAGDTLTNVVTASGTDDDGNPLSDDDDAVVTINDVPSAIEVIKIADPTSVDEPGGDVTYTFTVNNTSAVDSVTIDTLDDSIYGDLNGQGDCAVPQTIAAGGSYSCSVTVAVSGNAGDVITNVATGSGLDDDGNPVSDDDDADVTITDVPSSATLIKTADPTSVAEPGGTVTFTVRVDNTSAVDDLDLTVLNDDIYGDVTAIAGSTCTLPQSIAAGGFYECTFPGAVAGNADESQTDTVTGTLNDDDGNTLNPFDDATVTITDVPSSIEVIKTADPTSVDEPGGDVTYTFTVNNTSAVDSVTIDTLDDSIYGDLNGQGDCAVPQTIAAGGSYSCSVTVAVSGNAGDVITNVVTGSGLDDDGQPVSDDDDAVVTLNDVAAVALIVEKSADFLTLPEPGGTFTFSAVITNPSLVDTATITVLSDTYGTPVCDTLVLGPGASTNCTFSAEHLGNAGDDWTNQVSVTATDDDGADVGAVSNEVTVSLTDVPSEIEVLKTATPDNVDEPGGSVTYGFVVNNLSAVDAVTINSLNDTIYGDLNGQGDCSVPQTIAAGDSYSCSITVNVSGNAGDVITNVVTGSGLDDDGQPVSDDDDAVVTLNDVAAVALIVEKSADFLTLPEPGGTFTFSAVITNPSLVDTATITVLSDTYGTPVCDTLVLGPGASTNCTFSAEHLGNAGDDWTNQVSVTATDDDGADVGAVSNEVTVSLTDVPSEIEVLKTATPDNVDEPGGSVTYGFVVNNLSAVDAVTINSLNDTIYGDLNGQGDCSVPQTIAAGDSYSCSITVNVSGNAGDVITNVVTGSGLDDDGQPVSDDDDAVVTLNDVAAVALIVEKSADFLTLPEPGGTFTFSAVITNPSLVDTATITVLSDTYGTPVCDTLVLGPGASTNCTFSAEHLGNAGDDWTNQVSVTATDDDGADVGAVSNEVTVSLTDVPSEIEVLKTATPDNVDEPGGSVTYGFVVNNLSAVDAVTINSLNDTIYGDLNGQGDCSVPQTIAAGDSYSCSITVNVSGNAGDVITNVVTGSGLDDDGQPVSDDDDAVVTINDVPSSILTTKTANPTSVPETGGDVTFTIRVENTSAVDTVTINSVVDSVFGDVSASCSPVLPADLLPGETVNCTFTEFISGEAGQTHINVSTASGQDDDGNPVEDDDQEDVPFDDVLPDISIVKTADPTSVPETGGDVAFSFLVTNNSLEDATLDSLVDSDFGDLNGQGDCSVPQGLAGNGGTYTCSITVFLSGDASGPAHNNVVTATASDDDGNTDEDTDDETVPFDDVLPDISITKTADPTSIPETGDDVTFTFLVTNNSLEDATLDSLVDSDFGDLNGQGDCSVPQGLAGNGGTYTCSITVFLSGDASGPAHNNVVTATAFDDDGNTDEDTDDETVPFDDVLPDISIVKTADPTSVPETGGDVTFTFLVTNNSLEDATLDSLVDSDFGDLNGQGDCSVPQALAGNGGTYSCSITVFLSGDASGEAHNDVVTAIASDDDGNTTEDSDDETVTFEDLLPDISIVKTANPTSVPEPGADVEFTIVVTNNSLEDATIDSLVDTEFGLAANCADAVGTVLASGASYTCVFTEFIAGNVGEDHENTATVVASDNDGNSDTESASADVTITNVDPAISVDKTADQAQVFAPGENVVFTVVINNDSASTDPVTITSIVDNIHGDLNGQGTCLVPQTIQPGASYTCSFTVLVDGDETDVVTASGTDDEGTAVSASDNATVDMVNPSVRIEKSTNGFDADAAPGPEILAGSTVNWAYVVTNDGDVSLQDVTVTDNQGVTLSCPQESLAIGESMTCTATSTSVGGPYANLGTANAIHIDADGDTANRSDADPSHYLGATPSVDIVKTFADDSVIAGGAGSSFSLVVTNDGNVDLDNVSVFDDVDDRLTVTGVSATAGADNNSDGDAQTVEWLIDSLGVGESVTITVNFAVDPSVPEVLGLPNTATVSDTYTDDSGNSTDIGDEDSDNIDILVDINLSIVKTFDPTEVPQGTLQSFTIEVSNAGPSDAVDVSVTDTVDVSLAVEVDGVSVTSGTGDCSASAGQDVDCTVLIPAGESVTITVEYLVAPFLDEDPLFGGTGGDEFRFVFLNGSILEGSTATGEVYLDGTDVSADVTIITSLTRNDLIFDPPGSDLAFEMHLSCSDPFTDGWGGPSGGPVEGIDVNWQIAFFSIARYNNNAFIKNCGNVVNPFEVPNTGEATGDDSSGTETVSDDDTVTIGPGITLTRLQTNNKRLTVRLTNLTGDDKLIADVQIHWPDSNGNLKKIRLTQDRDSSTIWEGNAPLPSDLLVLDATDPGWLGGTLLTGDGILRFDFAKKISDSGHIVRVNFTDGTFLDISQ